jgi:hypothetical protein
MTLASNRVAERFATMKPYDENIQTFAAMFDGYDQALTRLERAAKGKEPAPAFIALFEALNWVVALDERAREHWTPEGKPLGYDWRDIVYTERT